MARIRTCYIASPAGTDLNILREALSRRGIRVEVPDGISPGANLVESITDKIRNVDLVIGILTSERRSQWVLFELGQAVAFGRQILLFAPPKLQAIPTHLMGFQIVRSSPTNRTAVQFALDQIQASPERKFSGPPPMSPEHPPLGDQADSLIADTRAAKAMRDHARLERAVVQALKLGGTDILSEARVSNTARDAGFGLAVWDDRLQSVVGNPLLIEIKARFHTQSELRKTAQTFANAVANSGSLWGLLLFGDAPFSEVAAKGLPPTILVCSTDSFINELRFRSFADVVLSLRNRRVHGGDS